MADKAQNEEPIYLSDTEERLSQDKDGELREELLKALVDEAFRLKSEQGKGLSPEDFEKSDAMITAVLASAEVIDKTWAKYHGKS